MLHLDDGITLEPEDISPKPNAAPLAPSAARPIRDGVLLSARPVHQPRPSKPRPELQMERGIPCIPPTAVTGRPVRWDSGWSCESYETEVRMLKQVEEHKSIINLFGDEQVGEEGWLFLEMATGGELFIYLATNEKDTL